MSVLRDRAIYPLKRYFGSLKARKWLRQPLRPLKNDVTVYTEEDIKSVMKELVNKQIKQAKDGTR